MHIKINMKASIVIPVYNEERDIGECLESLNKQSFKDFEIIIVDDGSIDNTVKIASKYKVQIIKGKHKGPGFSRNLGVRKAKGEILVFIDADMTFDKEYLKNLIKPFKDNKIIGTTHDYELATNLKNKYSKLWGEVRVSKENAKNVKIFRAIRKKKFLEMGGFDSKYGYADDQTFWFKYKIRPIVAKNTTCYHKNPETLKSVYNQSRWIGASIDNLLLKLPIIKYFTPWLLVLISPLIILLLSLSRSIKNKDFKPFFPWMILFMIYRYFGTISGIARRVYLNINIK